MPSWEALGRQALSSLNPLAKGTTTGFRIDNTMFSRALEWEVCELQMYRLEGNMIVERWFALGPIKATQLDCELR